MNEQRRREHAHHRTGYPRRPRRGGRLGRRRTRTTGTRRHAPASSRGYIKEAFEGWRSRCRSDRKRVLVRGGDRASWQESCDSESKGSAHHRPCGDQVDSCIVTWSRPARTPISAEQADARGYRNRSCPRTNGLPSSGTCASSIGSARTLKSSSAILLAQLWRTRGAKRLMTIRGIDMVVALAIRRQSARLSASSSRAACQLPRPQPERQTQSGPGPAYHGRSIK